MLYQMLKLRLTFIQQFEKSRRNGKKSISDFCKNYTIINSIENIINEVPENVD